ncbi:hypothetical protein AAFF_G00197580 [Aldrovandia affinis]|uniref:Uncharacterized protein n=1 Tax=Aldrovandia affinis TaxID=143900 RepID=A0AAD7RIA6_9TELE|nr:hypothetical protein AAFF_G00197580 [Aldrovandia affinis]
MLQPQTQATEGRQMNATVMSLPVLNGTLMKHIPQLIFLHDTEEKARGSTGTLTTQTRFHQAPSLLTQQKDFLFQLLGLTEQKRCLTQILIIPQRSTCNNTLQRKSLNTFSPLDKEPISRSLSSTFKAPTSSGDPQAH